MDVSYMEQILLKPFMKKMMLFFQTQKYMCLWPNNDSILWMDLLNNHHLLTQDTEAPQLTSVIEYCDFSKFLFVHYFLIPLPHLDSQWQTFWIIGVNWELFWPLSLPQNYLSLPYPSICYLWMTTDHMLLSLIQTP